ncbi:MULTISPECIES: radical SAM/SPASM domain-containing protein [unclassified Clostridioides]|uniref:radical SAM/SPASM domain-containing protein n=1 Tax=unclassified Clostridioides TaxID=2635829 RepID=UPI001D1303AD|nr:SPASM domain-containing protein [Clostridioides sp. ES-S-0171-01]MCC0686843.1 SPASM domain-containing protein [Clostridioides sp. ES-S-0056-01]MCC0713643.1 SPASM domain-containing protein [Clostridioides sp. ES-S-0077-01]UDN55415.1 SPASM domain-containing protein [Clostridioides sp. ES-S-0054-01]
MKSISVLIKPVSSLCNLRCRYCFYANVSDLREIKSYGIMQEDTIKNIVDNTFKVLNVGDRVMFAFQGGEPTLAGLKFFQYFIKYIEKTKKNIIVNYSIQTNGTLIDNQWCEFLKKNNFLVGLSLDLLKDLHDENRIYLSNEGTYEDIINTKKLLEKYKIEFNILCVLTNQIACNPNKVFNFIKETGIKYIQFIPCLDDLDCENKSEYSLEPKHFASFYKTVFKLWKDELDNGNYISINLFDNIISLLITGTPSTCGIIGKCQPQFVIEADGSVYPCDFYVLDNYNLGNIKDNTLLDILRKPIMHKFLHENIQKESICINCNFYRICGGGCKRMKNFMYIDSNSNYCGYKDFLMDNFNDLKKIAELMYKNQMPK